jgi:hypothetical protein
MLAAAAEAPPPAITSEEVAALERLLAHARRDSGQSRVVADFLLAWWNTGSCGAFGGLLVFSAISDGTKS